MPYSATSSRMLPQPKSAAPAKGTSALAPPALPPSLRLPARGPERGRRGIADITNVAARRQPPKGPSADLPAVHEPTLAPRRVTGLGVPSLRPFASCEAGAGVLSDHRPDSRANPPVLDPSCLLRLFRQARSLDRETEGMCSEHTGNTSRAENGDTYSLRHPQPESASFSAGSSAWPQRGVEHFDFHPRGPHAPRKSSHQGELRSVHPDAAKPFGTSGVERGDARAGDFAADKTEHPLSSLRSSSSSSELHQVRRNPLVEALTRHDSQAEGEAPTLHGSSQESVDNHCPAVEDSRSSAVRDPGTRDTCDVDANAAAWCIRKPDTRDTCDVDANAAAWCTRNPDVRDVDANAAARCPHDPDTRDASDAGDSQSSAERDAAALLHRITQLELHNARLRAATLLPPPSPAGLRGREPAPVSPCRTVLAGAKKPRTPPDASPSRFLDMGGTSPFDPQPQQRPEKKRSPSPASSDGGERLPAAPSECSETESDRRFNETYAQGVEVQPQQRPAKKRSSSPAAASSDEVQRLPAASECSETESDRRFNETYEVPPFDPQPRQHPAKKRSPSPAAASSDEGELPAAPSECSETESDRRFNELYAQCVADGEYYSGDDDDEPYIPPSGPPHGNPRAAGLQTSTGGEEGEGHAIDGCPVHSLPPAEHGEECIAADEPYHPPNTRTAGLRTSTGGEEGEGHTTGGGPVHSPPTAEHREECTAADEPWSGGEARGCGTVSSLSLPPRGEEGASGSGEESAPDCCASPPPLRTKQLRATGGSTMKQSAGWSSATSHPAPPASEAAAALAGSYAQTDREKMCATGESTVTQSAGWSPATSHPAPPASEAETAAAMAGPGDAGSSIYAQNDREKVCAVGESMMKQSAGWSSATSHPAPPASEATAGLYAQNDREKMCAPGESTTKQPAATIHPAPPASGADGAAAMAKVCDLLQRMFGAAEITVGADDDDDDDDDDNDNGTGTARPTAAGRWCASTTAEAAPAGVLTTPPTPVASFPTNVQPALAAERWAPRGTYPSLQASEITRAGVPPPKLPNRPSFPGDLACFTAVLESSNLYRYELDGVLGFYNASPNRQYSLTFDFKDAPGILPVPHDGSQPGRAAARAGRLSLTIGPGETKDFVSGPVDGYTVTVEFSRPDNAFHRAARDRIPTAGAPLEQCNVAGKPGGGLLESQTSRLYCGNQTSKPEQSTITGNPGGGVCGLLENQTSREVQDRAGRSTGGPGPGECDVEFPPAQASLCKPEQGSTARRPWFRLADVLRGGGGGGGSCGLLAAPVQPNTIALGSVADAGIASALAILAEFPALIARVFESGDCGRHHQWSVDARSDITVHRHDSAGEPPFGGGSGWHTTVLYSGGVQRVVRVDEYLPFEGYRPAFAHHLTECGELWVPLACKALAKCKGSYAAARRAGAAAAVDCLAGLPHDVHALGAERKLPSGGDLFAAARGGLRGGAACFVVTPRSGPKRVVSRAFSPAHGGGGPQEDSFSKVLAENGLLRSCGYAVVRVEEVASAAGVRKMVQIRNPWMDPRAWKGRWCHASTQWGQCPDVAAALSMDFSDDGCLWLEWDEVVAWFSTLSILHTRNFRTLTSLMRVNSGVPTCIVQLDMETRSTVHTTAQVLTDPNTDTWARVPVCVLRKKSRSSQPPLWSLSSEPWNDLEEGNHWLVARLPRGAADGAARVTISSEAPIGSAAFFEPSPSLVQLLLHTGLTAASLSALPPSEEAVQYDTLLETAVQLRVPGEETRNLVVDTIAF
ncbi:Calpain [Diplonema papillatum]|nr:Calpain [Diplonema papillatum]